MLAEKFASGSNRLMDKAPIPAPETPPAAEAVPAEPPAVKARSEKALRLAAALRANLRRRKAVARPARQSN
jgi:hypothetical protein